MEEMCRDSPLRAKYNLYADTNLHQTDRSTLSLAVLLSALFSVLYLEMMVILRKKKYIYVLFHVKRTALFAIKQLMYWNSYFDLESRFTLFSIQCLWSQITTHHIKHINNDVKRMDGIIFFPFWHVSCISMHLYNILHALSFAGWHMMAMRTICTKMVDLWIAWCHWKFLIDSSV